MRSRLFVTSLLLAIAAPAAAQSTNVTGVPTETQERLQAGASYDFPWDLLGLFGLFGLLGLRKEHREDSYHPAAVD